MGRTIKHMKYLHVEREVARRPTARVCILFYGKTLLRDQGEMESDLDDSMYLIPTIFISSPMVNEALFATVSGESCDIASSPAHEEFPHSDLFCRSSISPDFESDTESHEALYANLIEKRYEVEKLTEDNEWVSRETSSHDYGINSFLNDTTNKLYNIVFESTSDPEWASDIKDASRRKSQSLVIKKTPYDSLDSLLSKIADSVLASNKQEGTLSSALTEELLPDETTYQKSSPPESDVVDNLEENCSTPEENVEARGVEKTEDRLDENSKLAPVFFSQTTPDDKSRPSSRDTTSDRELLMAFEDLKNPSTVEKSKSSYGSIIKLLEANYYIKPEGSYHLPTNSLAFMNNKNSTTDYNPYYAFLPEYSASNKFEINKHHLNIKNCVARDNFGGSKLIKSCEFSHRLYPQDPLRFLTYVKSNNTGGDSQLPPDIHYNPYYTFLPKFDKCVVSNVEGRSNFEINTEVVKEVTHYESPSYETDESQDISRDGTGDGPPHDSGRAGMYRESKVDKMPVIVERQISCKQIKSKNNKRDSCTEVHSNDLIQKTSGFTTMPRNMDYSTPVVAIFPQDLIPETSNYMHEPVVAVISHLFRDSIPEPIVQESLSNHSGDPDSYYSSDDVCGFQVPVGLCNSAQLFVTEELGYTELSTEAEVRKQSESSLWRDIGWQCAKRSEDSDTSHHEDSSEEYQINLTGELKDAVCHSLDSLCHDEYREEGALEAISEKGTLEPPEDFANSRKKSDPLVMSSLYEHPHRHQEILPEMLSSMSSGALLRYQYVGCPLCSSSSTVIDDEDLELLLAHRLVPQTTTNEPERITRGSKSEAITVPSRTAQPTPPPKKMITIARQLLHPQVDSLLATQGQRQRHEYEANCIGDVGIDDYLGFTSSQRRRAILANVRLAAGGPLYMPSSPTHRRKLERERSVSAGHGDGQGRVPCPIHAKSKRATLPRSAPPTTRGEMETMRVSGANLTELTHLPDTASSGQYDAFPSSGKGDEISTVDQISRDSDCEKKKSECVLLDKDRMFIFSWETDSATEERQEISKRSYTLLHWSDTPYKSPPKEILADLLKRVISGVSSYHLQSQSLSGIRPSANVHRAQSLPKGRVKVSHSTSCSSKSLSQIEHRKSRKDSFSKVYNPCEISVNDAKMRKAQNEENSLYSKVSIPLCRKKHCDKLADKDEGVVTKKRTVTFKEQKRESYESDGDPVFTRQAFTSEVTESELNMFLSCPLLSESAIYSWWNLNRKVEEKNTQQMLLETSSNYSISSTSSEDCDFISWR